MSEPSGHGAPELEQVCRIEVLLGDPRAFGHTRDGERRFTPILGGEIYGIAGSRGPSAGALAALRAKILPGGGDRQLIRASGGLPGEGAAVNVVEIDARFDAETVEGTLLSVRSQGVRLAARGGVYFRVALRFESADPALAVLQDAVYIADGHRAADRVLHTVYRVG